MKYKNYYKILGLESSKASDDDIKNAYRKLAKQYHPDINQGDEVAAELFKDINEAYQILGNEDSKRKYDRIHFAYRIKDGIQSKETFNKGGFSDFVSKFVGKTNKQNVVTNLDDDKDFPIPGENLESEMEVTLEEAFSGVEKKLAFRQTDGKMKTIDVKIPQGVRDNSKIRIAEQGKPGKNGGKTGDLLISLKISKDEKFRLQGADLITTLKLTPWEAALGCKLDVQSLDSNILITVPPGVESGEKLRIANNGYFDGYGGRGDLLLDVKIVVPKELTEEEKQLFNKFKQISRFSPRNNWHLHNFVI